VIKEAVIVSEGASQREVKFPRTVLEVRGRPASALFVVAVHGVDGEYCSFS